MLHSAPRLGVGMIAVFLPFGQRLKSASFSLQMLPKTPFLQVFQILLRPIRRIGPDGPPDHAEGGEEPSIGESQGYGV